MGALDDWALEFKGQWEFYHIAKSKGLVFTAKRTAADIISMWCARYDDKGEEVVMRILKGERVPVVNWIWVALEEVGVSVKITTETYMEAP